MLPLALTLVLSESENCVWPIERKPRLEKWRPCLEVCPAASPYEEGVAREDAMLGVRHVRDAPVGVSGRRAHLELVFAEGDLGAVADFDVGRGAACGGDDGLDGRNEFLEQTRAGDVVGVQMGVY